MTCTADETPGCGALRPAGYVLQQYHGELLSDCNNVDKAYRLISDPLVLYGVESAMFAPDTKLRIANQLPEVAEIFEACAVLLMPGFGECVRNSPARDCWTRYRESIHRLLLAVLCLSPTGLRGVMCHQGHEACGSNSMQLTGHVRYKWVGSVCNGLPS